MRFAGTTGERRGNDPVVPAKCCGLLMIPLNNPGSKAIISLDLDLYEKVYLLVNSREDLRNRYVICLGELHIAFAYFRAIGTYIECFGLDDCWMRANLFEENTYRQVLTRARSNRAIQYHESTWISISINILQTIVNEISRNRTLTPSSLINILRELQVFLLLYFYAFLSRDDDNRRRVN